MRFYNLSIGSSSDFYDLLILENDRCIYSLISSWSQLISDRDSKMERQNMYYNKAEFIETVGDAFQQ